MSASGFSCHSSTFKTFILTAFRETEQADDSPQEIQNSAKGLFGHSTADL